MNFSDLSHSLALQQAGLSQASFAEKAKATAASAWKKTKLEKLKMEQRLALIELGAKWRTGAHSTPPELAAEMKASQAVAAAIQAMDVEIAKMRRGTYRWAKRPFVVLLLVLLAVAGVAVGRKALTRNHGPLAAAAPRVVDFKGYNQAGWVEGFYKGEMGPLNANRQEVLFYCNFFDQTVGDLAPLLHDVEIQQLIASQILRHQLPDQMAGFRAMVDFFKQAHAPNGPQQMMENAMSQEKLKAQAKLDAQRLVATGDKETVQRVYNGLRAFVRDEGRTGKKP
jgi:hypothetical protein